MRPRRIFSRPLLAALLLAASAAPAAGQAQTERTPDGDGPYQRSEVAQRAIARIKSPYCPGQMLEVCPSPGGAALRDSIDHLADEGWSADSIVDWVLARHGQEYSAVPPARGAGLLAWLVPPLAVLLGIGLVVVVLRRIRASHPAPAGPSGPLSPDDEARLREALRELETEEEASFF